MKRTLPLFPLETVLFPGADLPLQIFEPRYRDMLRDCVSADRRFGVVLIKAGQEVGGDSEPFSVGTVAHIKEIGTARRGAIPIVVEGEQRFRTLSIDRMRSYLMAEVEIIEDDEVAPEKLLSEAQTATHRYLSAVLAAQGVFKSDLEVPPDPAQLSYFMGMVAGSAPLRSLQVLLEAEALADRLQVGISLLEEETVNMRNLFMRSGPGRDRSLFSTN